MFTTFQIPKHSPSPLYPLVLVLLNHIPLGVYQNYVIATVRVQFLVFSLYSFSKVKSKEVYADVSVVQVSVFDDFRRYDKRNLQSFLLVEDVLSPSVHPTHLHWTSLSITLRRFTATYAQSEETAFVFHNN